MTATPDSIIGLGLEGIVPPTSAAPALDLTGKITKLDDHYSKAGGFSDVYKCHYTSSDCVKEVAVKAFRFPFTVAENERRANKTEKMVRRELGIWRRLRHPNIVPFLGFVHDFERHGRTSLVSEWMPNGTLESFCEQYDDQLTLGHRLQLLVDIASGLSYLHSFPLVHGDLTCTNVLVDENFNARLTDFGLTSMVGDIPDALRYLQMTTMRPGAIRWSAPECFSVDAKSVAQRTTKSDIYSFGNLALLVLSGNQPWSEVPYDIAVIFRLHRGDKPSRPTSRPIQDRHWRFIEHCWSAVNGRPQAEAVVSSLKGFLNSCGPTRSLADLLLILSESTTETPESPPSPLTEVGTSTPAPLGYTSLNNSPVPRVMPMEVLPIPPTPGLKRRRSFDSRLMPWEPAWPIDGSSRCETYPLLDAVTPNRNFYFDLALSSYAPTRWFGIGSSSLIPGNTLLEPAVFPPMTRIRITHDAIPQWPIDVGLDYHDRYSDPPFPVRLGDVLFVVHASLRRQITHQDWAQLSEFKKAEIAGAFSRRCQSAPSSTVEKSQGVKRIDYLLRETLFKGLVRAHGENEFYHWRLITGAIS